MRTGITERQRNLDGMVEIIKNMPFEEYKARPGINASILKTVSAFSLLHAKAEMDGIVSKETKVFSFGKCCHSLVLEGVTDWVVRPETYAAPADHASVKKGLMKAGDPLPWNWNAGVCDEWKQRNKDKIILTPEENSRVIGMRDALMKDPEVAQLTGGENELSVFVEKDGLQMKCRIDALPNGDNLPVVDMKTGDCVEPEMFMNNAMKYGWDIQAAWNLDVLRLAGKPRKEFWFVGAEVDPPHAHTIIKFRDEQGTFLRLGRIKYRAALQNIKNAMASGVWSSYKSGYAEEFARDYLLKQLEQTLG